MSWVTVKEIRQLLRERGNPRSLEALKNAGMKYGFVQKQEDGFHYLFDTKRVCHYLDLATSFPTITQFAKSLGVTVSQLYYQMLKKGIKAKEQYGIKYLDPKDQQKLKAEFE